MPATSARVATMPPPKSRIVFAAQRFGVRIGVPPWRLRLRGAGAPVPVPSAPMFDLATAAVEAALAAGARYADARIMIVRYESMGAKNRVVEGLTQTEAAGIGVRALIGSSWGFQSTPELTAVGGRAARGSVPPRWPGPAPASPARPVELSPAPGGRGHAGRTPTRSTPSTTWA